MWYSNKKIIVVCGHYGSGKTNLAVNLALTCARQGKKTALVDLDIVNPYFRAADNLKELQNNGVRCILPQFANTNVDVPSLPPQIHSVFLGDETVIFDVGGDKDGAMALGVYRSAILKAGYEMIGVCNMYRPLTQTVEETLDNLAEIETQCGLAFTALVNNSNLGEETTADDIIASFSYADTLSEKSALPLLFTSVSDKVALSSDRALFLIHDITRKIY